MSNIKFKEEEFNRTATSCEDLLKNKLRLGQSHYLKKIKEAEDALNSAFEHLCSVVAEKNLVVSLRFNPAEGGFATYFPLKRRVDSDGKDITQNFVDEVIGSPTDILVEGPNYCNKDLLQISVSEETEDNTKKDKISIRPAIRTVVTNSNGEKTILLNQWGVSKEDMENLGFASKEEFLKTYYWVEPEVLGELKTKLSQEVETLDKIEKFSAWVVNPNTKDSRASNLFKEISDLLELFQKTLVEITPANPQHEAIRRMDGFLLYCKQVGIIQGYGETNRGRFEAFESLKHLFDLNSGVDNVKSGLPVVRKYSSFKSIESFLNWLYSFWGSASNQSFSGRVTAILCSKPNSGSLGKSGTTSKQKPTGGKGKGKGKDPSSKKDLKKEPSKAPKQKRAKGKSSGTETGRSKPKPATGN